MRETTDCAAPECGRPKYCKGYCSFHYERWRTKGTVDDAAFQAYGRTGCLAPGCDAPHRTNGYCEKHDYRMRTWGTVDDPPTTCSAEGCARPCFSRGKYAGLCRGHAERVRVHGTTGNPRPDLRARFMAKVSYGDNGCWPWTGSVNEDGYAVLLRDGRPRKAYIIAFDLFKGGMPAGLSVDHACHSNQLDCPGGILCEHRRCVNPDHLEAVPMAENRRRGWVNRQTVAQLRRSAS